MSVIIYGKNAVLEALRANQQIEKIFLSNTLRSNVEVDFQKLCEEKNIPLSRVPLEKVEALAKNKQHQGYVAIAAELHYLELTELLNTIDTEKAFLVLIDGVSDVRNIGGIARSAYYFGADGIILCGQQNGRINEDTVKASAGALLHMKVARCNNTFEAISLLQSKMIKVVASSLKNSIPLKDCDLKESTAFILGSEGKGLSDKILQVVDESVIIPRVGNFDSLNVSVASGILFYELSQARIQGPK